MRLLLAWGKNFQHPVCGSNCLELAKTLKRNTYDFHVYGSALLDLHLLLSCDLDVRIHHVRREANVPAYCLVGLGDEL